ncbi:Protein serine/threonine phosphatase PrpC, regulation of stationary phase [Rhodovulum sp. P5]|uniref:PP2C family protein-serine/threonine phosphatase n=1 Tax=Rhodovulum sp. P5 TaxID=1564506 RepID=UPI0009C1D547|nr:protein phosphatase 2C domain-containing protein [Rhodovulum sp. P5]ARE41194.1 Protein serine/threonine phosphatase PrpC, regulation of stationary phase [Rhodovulum sp. P5]
MKQDSGFTFQTGQATDVGKRRKINEDSLLARPERGLWVVADGMGGHSAGDFASQTVVAALDRVDGADTGAALLAQVSDSIAAANRRIHQEARDLQTDTIGATVVVLMAHGSEFTCLWSGDSRVYQLRGGKLTQTTRDHTEVQMLLDAGAISPEQAANWPRRNVITHAIGVDETPEFDVVTGTLEADDTFILCSDGLTEHLSDYEIAIYADTLPPQDACDAMVALTLDRGAKDNVTVVVMRCLPGEELEPVTMDDMLGLQSDIREDEG